MKPPLTEQQNKVFKLWRSVKMQRKPSLQSIATRLQISKERVKQHLANIKRKGYAI